MAETGMTVEPNLGSRILRFLRKPSHERSRSVYARWRRLFRNVPLPVRLPFGVWWIARNDYIGVTVLYDGFEIAERKFLRRFLRPGMTVLDIGSHHGFYALFLSKLVGKTGRVIAFEPSPRERRALRLNLLINFVSNVEIHAVALGEEIGQSKLHLGEGFLTGCNSLKNSPSVHQGAAIPVTLTTLDRMAKEHGICNVEFIKLDVEGGELAVLRGAKALLLEQPRPVVLAEIEDRRTEAWGYPASEILGQLTGMDYEWFTMTLTGRLEPIGPQQDYLEANLVAIPKERRTEILARVWS
jgi:FkbM family methyltransferase